MVASYVGENKEFER
jgi:acyl CoA:acetate/3-ketoacid CoA transferase alpha subunit